MEQQETLYSILGVEPDADQEEIREKYRILAREYHPDLNPTHHDIALFIRVRRAYETLKNKKSRLEYDKTLGIYHSKDIGTEFLRDTSRRIQRDKLEGLDDFDEDDEKLPQSVFDTPKESGFLSKLTGLFSKKPKPIIEPNNQRITKPNPLPQMRKRSYQFSINILESILGTERIIVLDDTEGQQSSIKVKIPKGISNNTTLNIFHPEKGSIPIKILLLEHPQLARRNLDITITLPFSDEELKFSQPAELFTCKGRVKIKIPADSTKALRIKGHGLSNPASGEVGDFYIKASNGGPKAPVDRIQIQKLLEPLHTENLL